MAFSCLVSCESHYLSRLINHPIAFPTAGNLEPTPLLSGREAPCAPRVTYKKAITSNPMARYLLRQAVLLRLAIHADLSTSAQARSPGWPGVGEPPFLWAFVVPSSKMGTFEDLGAPLTLFLFPSLWACLSQALSPLISPRASPLAMPPLGPRLSAGSASSPHL